MSIDVSKIISCYPDVSDGNKTVYVLDNGTTVTVDKNEIISKDQLAASVFWVDSNGDGEGDTYVFEGCTSAQVAAVRSLGITTTERAATGDSFESRQSAAASGNSIIIKDKTCTLPNGVVIEFKGDVSEEAIRTYATKNIWQDKNGLWHIENLNTETINGPGGKKVSTKITGTSGDDTIIINNAENLLLEARDGNDKIVIDGKCKDLDIKGDNGNDTIINNADLQDDDKSWGLRFGGQDGDDTIINYGKGVQIWGDSGADTYVNYGDKVIFKENSDNDKLMDFGKKTDPHKKGSEHYIKNNSYSSGADNRSKDKTVTITEANRGADYVEYKVSDGDKVFTLTLKIEDGKTPTQDDLQSQIYFLEDGTLCFDGLNNAIIEGTEKDDKILVQNSSSVTVFGQNGNDTISFYNCVKSTVNGGEGNDNIAITNSKELSKADANTAVGGNGRDTFFIKSPYATVDFGSDTEQDYLLSYVRNVTLKNQDTTSDKEKVDVVKYIEFAENGDTGTTSSAAPVTTPSSSLPTTYDPFGGANTGVTTPGTTNTGAAYTNYTPFSTTGGTYSFDSTQWASNILANAPGDINYGSYGGFSFDTMNWASNIFSDNFYGTSNFAGSTNYGFNFSSYDFSFGSSSGFNFAQNPITGLGLTSCTDAVRKTFEEAEAEDQEEAEAQSE